MLIGVELVREFVEAVIMTGRLKEHEPVSAILIGAPETGKTSIVTQKNCKAIEAFSDVTGRGLIEICKTKPDISHIVINDMVAIMSHKQTVNRYTQAMLNAITEEGIQNMATPDGVETVPDGKRGVICAITADLSTDGRNWWHKIGLMSRLLPFAYCHSGKLTLKIKAMIDSEKNAQHADKETLRLPAVEVRVKFPQACVGQVRKIADEKSKEFQELGYRRLKQFRSLVCGHALLRSRKSPTVGEAEIEFLEKIFPYISYDKLTPL